MEFSTTTSLTTVQTLEDVINLIGANTRLSETSRRDLVSDLKTSARLIGRHPSEIVAEVPSLRAELQKVAPGAAGISSKRFTNIRSSLKRALRIVRAMPRKPPKAKFTSAWQTIWDGIEERHLKVRLSQFIKYCSNRRISPEEVDEATIERFREYLNITSLYQDPKKIADDAARAFNRVSEKLALGLSELNVSKTGRYVTRPLEAYSVSFQDDLAAYETILTRSDYFAEKGPTKPLRPASVIKIKADVRQVLNAAVEAGLSIESFTTLADLVSERTIEAAFGWLKERNGGKYPVGLKDMAATLIAIAKHHVGVQEEGLRRLKVMRTRVSTYEEGMSEKNRLRLQQFDDPNNARALVCLPDKLIARARQGPELARSASDVMYATAITLLLACPMRMKNLAGLDLDRHIHPFGRGANQRYRISIPGSEVKNGVAIDVELQADASKVLARYLRDYRHRLVCEPNSALFPSEKGGPRSAHSLGYGIKSIIRKETGLEVHPHLFRHLTAKLYLEVYHGDYESVRRQLGHKKYDTTLKFYATFDNRRAQERFSSVVLEAKKPKKTKRG